MDNDRVSTSHKVVVALSVPSNKHHVTSNAAFLTSVAAGAVDAHRSKAEVGVAAVAVLPFKAEEVAAAAVVPSVVVAEVVEAEAVEEAVAVVVATKARTDSD